MTESVRMQCEKAVQDYLATPRTEWVLRWPGKFDVNWRNARCVNDYWLSMLLLDYTDSVTDCIV